jgi:deoxycytidine triphosphate deaminase
MKNITKTFPMGVGKFNRANTEGYTVIDVSDRSREKEMLEWLESYDHSSWFAWERPRNTMVFEDSKMAELFVLKWA